ncbi:MAG: isoleucine--tRNA ligase, partial [Chloroflexi bacterium]|nr:isoleucine--tRNA ligase [Chloroflexota bacterium]
SFIDGPITANNPMGVHHAWGRTYKDLWHRFKAMRGFSTRYQNGFDGQGLWIEVEVEKELGFTSKRDIEEYGIARFVEKCKERVLKFAAIQTQQSIRMGYWMDLDNSYHTMSDENNYTIWLFLKRCHERGWIYKGHDVMPWCPRCSTGLSDMEIATEGYEEVVHAGIFLKFPLLDRERESLLVWTTTPWTLTSNVAAAVHPELHYVKVQQGEEYLYLAKAALGVLKGDYKLLEEFAGEKLEGLRYTGPFDELPPQKGVEHRVILWKEVSETEGTGVVHIAPGCGKEDFLLSKEHNLTVIAPLDEFGVFIAGFAWLTGKKVDEVAQPIVQNLSEKGLLYKVEDYPHRYPVCWRCHTELVFRLVDEWFISMDELRPMLMEVAKKIHWIPDFGLERELDWLKNMSDWMISKKRYWGLALPIYECRHGHFEVIGSEVELKERAVEGWEEYEGHSPHRPWIDAVKIRLKECGEVASRIPDVGNPWLDAGIVPFSTLDYRHHRDYWERWFPAQFITEAFPGQYRNWFYALLVMSTVLENRPPFLTVLGHATVRDEKGEEMHKSKGNLILFDEAAEKVGVDVIRWMYALQRPEANLNFGYRVTDEVRRRFFIPLWNVYSFFVTYARIDGWTPQKTQPVEDDLDRWILSRLQFTIRTVTDSLESYDAETASRVIESFVEDLSNWYVRRSRRRFWKSEKDTDKNAAYSTLYRCLVTLCQLLAPFTPFLAEEIYQNLVRSIDSTAAESVHHTAWPEEDSSLIDRPLEADIALVMKVVSIGHAARNLAGIKVRQPLAEVAVVAKTAEERRALERLATPLLEELNVKQLTLADHFSPQEGYVLAEEDGYILGLNTLLTPELKSEGMSREVVRRIQELRKKAGFQIQDRIITYYQAGDSLRKVFQEEGDYIRKETLSEQLIEGELPAEATKDKFKIDGQELTLGVVRK